MSFLSLEFILFVILVAGGYWFVFTKEVSRKRLLVFSSLLFISTHSYILTLILILGSLINILLLKKIMAITSKRTEWLSLALVLNFLIIAFSGIFVLKTPYSLSAVGLSFYYFKVHSLFFDAFNDYIESPVTVLDYLSFLSFFPLVLSGPLSSYQMLSDNPAWKSRKTILNEVLYAVLLFIRGMTKKILISTFLYNQIANILNRSTQLGGGDIFLIFILNFFYITSDLSAYTDMARALTRLFGFDVPMNFKFSYLARDIGDFWKRHHITVSNWFRQYLFFPLWLGGGALTSSALAGTLALFFTFLASGLWHSFSIAGLIFTSFHFLAFILLLKSRETSFHKLLNYIVMWTVVLITFWGLAFPWQSLITAFNSATLFSGAFEVKTCIQILLVVGFFIALDWINLWTEKKQDTSPPLFFLLHSCFLILTFIFWDLKPLHFLYFNF